MQQNLIIKIHYQHYIDPVTDGYWRLYMRKITVESFPPLKLKATSSMLKRKEVSYYSFFQSPSLQYNEYKESVFKEKSIWRIWDHFGHFDIIALMISLVNIQKDDYGIMTEKIKHTVLVMAILLMQWSVYSIIPQ